MAGKKKSPFGFDPFHYYISPFDLSELEEAIKKADNVVLIFDNPNSPEAFPNILVKINDFKKYTIKLSDRSEIWNMVLRIRKILEENGFKPKIFVNWPLSIYNEYVREKK